MRRPLPAERPGRRAGARSGSVNEKTLPPSGRGLDPDRARRGARRSACTSARPMPVPGYASAGCRRPNILKIASAGRASTPMPLSRTVIRHDAAVARGADVDRGRDVGRGELHRVGRSRFWSTCASWPRSPRTVGRSSLVDPRAALARSPARARASTSPSTSSRSTCVAADRRPPDARVQEQVVDELLHPVDAGASCGRCTSRPRRRAARGSACRAAG